MRQRLSVHLEGNDRVWIIRLGHGDALHEVGRLARRTDIRAIQHDFHGIGREACLGQHVLQAHAFPARVAHGAIAPFNAGNMRLRQPTAVAGALADSHDLDLLETGFQISEREAQRRRAADVQGPFGRIDLRDIGQVITHEESVIGRHDILEHVDRTFEIRRAITQLDQWALARQRLQDRFVGGTLRNAWRGDGRGFSKARHHRCQGHSSHTGEHISTCQHVFLPFIGCPCLQVARLLSRAANCRMFLQRKQNLRMDFGEGLSHMGQALFACDTGADDLDVPRHKRYHRR